MNGNIFVFGSVNRDHVYSVEHLVNPGETISSSKLHLYWGGKGLNQAIALAKAGIHPVLVAKVNETEKDALRVLCTRNGVSVIAASSEQPTGHAVIQVDGDGQNGIIVYPGANGDIQPQDIENMLGRARAGDCVLLQNEVNDIPRIITACHSRGLKVLLNPSPVSPEMKTWPLKLLELVIMNETEGKALSGRSAPEDILAWFAAAYPALTVVLTVGQDGSYYQKAGVQLYQPAFRVKTVDTTAAGDTFTGYFLAGWLAGCETARTLCTAAKAASIAVSRRGATNSIPTVEEVAACMAVI